MKKLVFGCSVLSAFAALAVNVDSVLVRQDWPWSSTLKVEYRVSDTADKPFDATVAVFNGETQVSADIVKSALLDGELYGVDGAESLHVLSFDPKVLFGDSVKAVPNVRVTVSAATSPESMTEVLYKIFDLEAAAGSSPLDITRADLLNGKYGAIETDYSKIGTGFSTTLDDVLIWTDAVNYPGAKTTKLIMRKVPAAGKTFTFGSDASEYGHQNNETKVQVKLTEDFFIGIFEFTQKQFKLIHPEERDAWGNKIQPFTYSGDAVAYHYQRNRIVRGTHDLKSWDGVHFLNWPNNTEYPHTYNTSTICGKLRVKFGYVEFDLPTEAQWEFACRAGSATSLPSGRDVGTGSQQDSNANKYSQECGWIYWYNQKEEERFVHEVGLKAPNAYGLYDMIGNVSEQCLDWMSASTVSWASDSLVTDPVGPTSDENPTNPNYYKRVLRGPNYQTWYSESRIAYRKFNNGGEGTQLNSDTGFRVVIPASANGKWASSPEKTH